MTARLPRPRRRFAAATATSALVASGLAVVALAPPAQAAAEPTPECTATSCTVSYDYTGERATFTVPADVTSVHTEVIGAAGGGYFGGRGGGTQADLPVSPGQKLTVLAGQKGDYGPDSHTRTFGGGGAVDPMTSIASSGGGGSFVFDDEGRLLVAAGGGGGSQANSAGGRDGGAGSGARTAASDGSGGNGQGSPPISYIFDPSQGGTQSGGGRGGLTTSTSTGSPLYNRGMDGSGPAANGSPGLGGDSAAASTSAQGSGGGGGGGYYGGGGASYIQGGGGGSGFAASTATDVGSSTGANSSAGSISFSWSITQTTTTTLGAAPASGVPSQADTVTLTATVAATDGTPTGTVAFTDRGTTIAGCGAKALSDGTATCLTSFSAGTHPLVAEYAGQDAYLASASDKQDYVVANRPKIAKSILPTATVGTAYSQTLQVSGGTTPYDFAVTGGELPAGLDLDSETGTISGIPTAATTTPVQITVTVKDAAAESGSRTFSLSVNKAAQTVSFTFEPTDAKVGDTYTIPATTKGKGSQDLVLTGNDTCTVSGTTMSFVHAGTCTVTATQAGDDNYSAADPVEHTVAIGKAAQTLTVTSNPPATGVVGGSHALVVSGGPSSSSISVSLSDSTTNSACSLGTVGNSVVGGLQRASATIGYDKVGTCSIVLQQGGDDDHAGSQTAFVVIDVQGKVTTTALTLSAGKVVHGQPVTATATVTGATAGHVDFYVDGRFYDRRTLGSDGTATSRDLAARAPEPGRLRGALPTGLPVGDHEVTAEFTPTDTDTYAGSETLTGTDLTVSAAKSTTTLKVNPTSLVATVRVKAPSADTPTGTVTFAVGGTEVGTADVDSRGVATLDHTVPAGKARTVAATYAGREDADENVEISGSSASTARKDPTITATVTSRKKITKYGYFSEPVTVRFTCKAGSAPLTAPCPTKVTIVNNGVHTITRTVLTTDGGARTINVTVKYDHSSPGVSVVGPVAGRLYPGKLPKARCVATERASGLASCVLTRTVTRTTATWKALATDKAGNTRRASVTVRRK